MGDLVNEVYTISSDEIEAVIKDLPKGNACGSDNISAELLQGMGEKGIEIMTNLINKIFRSGYIPEDFRNSIFVPFPKVSRAYMSAMTLNDRSDFACTTGFVTSDQNKNHTNN